MTYKKLVMKFIVTRLLITQISILLVAAASAFGFLWVTEKVQTFSQFWICFKYGILFLTPVFLLEESLCLYRRVLIHKQLAKKWDVTPEFLFIGLEEFNLAGRSYFSKTTPKLRSKNLRKEKYEMNYSNFLFIFTFELIHKEGLVKKVIVMNTGKLNGVKIFNVAPRLT